MTEPYRRFRQVKEGAMADPIEVARRHDDAFNVQDVDGRRMVEAPDIETVLPGGMVLHGPDEVHHVVSAFWAALPDGRIIVDKEFVQGDTVVIEGTLVGTHKGSFPTPEGEVPASGNRVSLRYAAVKQIREGKLVSEHLYFDQLEFLQQLGVFPAAAG